MARPDKIEKVEVLRQELTERPSAALVDYRTLSVKEMSDLRSRVKATGGTLRVVKNTLFRRALEGTPTESLEPYVIGPTAVAFCGQDAVETLKALVEYIRANPKIRVMGGFVEGRAYPGEKIEQIARLPRRTELLGRLVGSLEAPVTSLVQALHGLVGRLVWALEEIEGQKAVDSRQ